MTQNSQPDYSVQINYKNHAGEYRLTSVIPHKIWFGAAGRYTDKQWLMEVYDLEDRALVVIALTDIESIGKPVKRVPHLTEEDNPYEGSFSVKD